jgi:two-component system cell cycle response regulator
MKKTILVVEAEPRIVEVLPVRLKAAGSRVLAAAVLAGMRALTPRPDLALLDIPLPGGTGLLVAERRQHGGTTAGIPVIVLTASRQPGLRANAMALGAVAFFEKPYDAHQLLAAIARALGEPVAHRSAFVVEP